MKAMSTETHSPQYLRRRTFVRAVFWTPITALGFGMIISALVEYLTVTA